MENFKMTEDEIQAFLEDKETKENIEIIDSVSTKDGLMIFIIEHYSRHDLVFSAMVEWPQVREWVFERR